MASRTRARWSGGVAALALVCAASAGASDDSASSPTDDASETSPAGEDVVAGDGGELVIALATQPAAIDPINAPSVVEGNVAYQMFDSLIWINDDGEIEPALAESWTVSDDGTVYTFTLRQGVTFHDGEDFQRRRRQVHVGRRARTRRTRTSTNSTWLLTYGSSTTTRSRSRAPEPNALFLVQVGQWPMLPPKYYTEVGLEGFAEAPVGTGAFKLVEWVQGDRIVHGEVRRLLARGLPAARPRRVPADHRVVDAGGCDPYRRRRHRQPAQPDRCDLARWCRRVSTSLEYSNNRVYYIAFNNLTSGVGQPTENVLVRQAMNLRGRQAGHHRRPVRGQGQRSPTALLVSGDVGYDDAVQPYPYDPEQAKQLLTDAGFGDGFSIGMACPSDAYTNFSRSVRGRRRAAR